MKTVVYILILGLLGVSLIKVDTQIPPLDYSVFKDSTIIGKVILMKNLKELQTIKSDIYKNNKYIDYRTKDIKVRHRVAQSNLLLLKKKISTVHTDSICVKKRTLIGSIFGDKCKEYEKRNYIINIRKDTIFK